MRKSAVIAGIRLTFVGNGARSAGVVSMKGGEGMTDREKVINALERCINGCDNECPYEYGGAVTLEYCRDDLMRDALELLKEHEVVAPIINNWVNVNDNLPDIHTNVFIAIYSNNLKFTYRAIGWLNSNKKWYSPDMTDGDEVTHWMPLPKLPEEDIIK